MTNKEIRTLKSALKSETKRACDLALELYALKQDYASLKKHCVFTSDTWQKIAETWRFIADFKTARLWNNF